MGKKKPVGVCADEAANDMLLDQLEAMVESAVSELESLPASFRAAILKEHLLSLSLLTGQVASFAAKSGGQPDGDEAIRAMAGLMGIVASHVRQGTRLWNAARNPGEE